MKKLLLFAVVFGILLIISPSYGVIPSGADLLIIVPDGYEDNVEPLVDWKMKKGILTRVVTLSETGSGSTNINNYIQDAYETWDPAPQYVILGWFNNNIPMILSGSTSYGNFNADWPYGNVDDSDSLNDIYVGRFPAKTEDNFNMIVNKTIKYETDPESGNWLSRGVTSIRLDGDSSDSTYHANTDTLEACMSDVGYISIRSLLSSSDDRNDIEYEVNTGVGMASYRGQGTTTWWNPFNVDLDDINCGYMNPFILSITCHTVEQNTSGYEYGDMWMNDGTAASPSGAIGLLGTTSTISHGAYLRGEVLEGFAQQWYSDTATMMGRCAEHARLNTLYHSPDDEGVWAQYTSHVLMGDPTLTPRTRVPSTLVASHSSAAILDESNSFTVTVTSGGSPVVNADVCIWIRDDIQVVAATNSSGVANLTFTPTVIDTAFVTVTKKDYIPYMGNALIIENGPNVYYSSFTIDDGYGGNDDGYVNAGESIRMNINLGNDGTETASSVTATLSCSDAYVTITSATRNFGNIPVSGSRNSLSPFVFEVSETCPKGHSIQFNLDISDAASNTWEFPQPTMPVEFPDIVYSSHTITTASPFGDGDAILEPGEVGKIVVTAQNTGNGSLAETQYTMAAPFDDNLFEEDESSLLESFDAGATEASTSDPFWLALAPYDAPPAPSVTIDVYVEGDGFTYTYYDTFQFDLELGGTITYTGPDEYGYYCYDDTDIETGRAPTYSWSSITGSGSTISSVTNEDDAIGAVSLPFSFNYYGQTFSNLSVGSNGFCAMGTETWSGGGSAGHERVIPNAGEAAAIVSGFWDDLNPGSVGDIYQYSNTTDNIFTIEYDGVCHYGSTTSLETYQVIFYRETYYPTITDDGEIVIMYNDVSNATSNAVGIESPDETIGLQYVYRNSYDSNAETIQDGRAVKFTTNPPTGTDPFVVVTDYVTNEFYPLGNGNYFIEDGESSELTVSLTNQGVGTASNVTATLSSASSFITVTENYAEFGTMYYGTTLDNLTPYEFDVSGITAPQWVDFRLTITANSGAYTRVAVVPIRIWVDLGIEDNIEKPKSIEISKAYPNPFNSRTSLEILSDSDNIAEIAIFNVDGKMIQKFNRKISNGSNIIDLDLTNHNSGLYLYSIRTGDVKSSGKLMYIK